MRKWLFLRDVFEIITIVIAKAPFYYKQKL